MIQKMKLAESTLVVSVVLFNEAKLLILISNYEDCDVCFCFAALNCTKQSLLVFANWEPQGSDPFSTISFPLSWSPPLPHPPQSAPSESMTDTSLISQLFFLPFVQSFSLKYPQSWFLPETIKLR
jgi:hypothetical protein